jgi:ATP-dependent RNA helicase DHX8/PRP22
MASTELPIARCREAILAALRASPLLIVVGETGCGESSVFLGGCVEDVGSADCCTVCPLPGKTTQLPQYILDAPGLSSRAIGITQPRRVAAIAAAERVADERRVDVGSLVGYAVRWDACCSATTRIRFMTDGVLLRECLEDPELSRYDILLLDEAHERSLHVRKPILDHAAGCDRSLVRRTNRRRISCLLTFEIWLCGEAAPCE